MGLFYSFFSFSGGITISFPEMGLSGLSVQAKIEILFAKLCVCVCVCKCTFWGFFSWEEDVFCKIRDCLWLWWCVMCMCLYVCLYFFFLHIYLSDRFQLNVFQLHKLTVTPMLMPAILKSILMNYLVPNVVKQQMSYSIFICWIWHVILIYLIFSWASGSVPSCVKMWGTILR